MVAPCREVRVPEAAARAGHAEAWRRETCSLTDDVAPVVEAVLAAMSAHGYRRRDLFGMRLALEEAVVNAIKHGHRNDPAKAVQVRYRVSPEHALVEVEDQGPGFDPFDVPDPTADERLGRTGGRGLLLMRAYLTWLRYSERGNCVTLCKRPSL